MGQSKWQLHGRLVAGLGVIAAMLVALLMSSARSGLDGLGNILASIFLVVGFIAHAVLTTVLVELAARRRSHVVAVHVATPFVAAGVLALLFAHA